MNARKLLILQQQKGELLPHAKKTPGGAYQTNTKSLIAFSSVTQQIVTLYYH